MATEFPNKITESIYTQIIRENPLSSNEHLMQQHYRLEHSSYVHFFCF